MRPTRPLYRGLPSSNRLVSASPPEPPPLSDRASWRPQRPQRAARGKSPGNRSADAAPGPITLLDAVGDPNLFAPWFRDRATWAAWLAFLRALFGLPMDADDLTLLRRHAGRTVAPTGPTQEAWLVVGRRGGKSRVLALIAVFLACFRDWSAYLSPGERGVVMVLASDRRQARVIFGYVRALLADVPLLAPMVEREGQEFIELNNRISVEIHTSSFKSVRGYTVVAALLDEIAFWPSDDSANPDTEILNALRPAMATVPGSLLLAASSPYARRGALYAAYRKHFGQDGDPVLVWQAPTRAMNSTVPQSLIDAAMEEDPASASAEWMAEFRADIEGYVTREVVDAATIAGRHELPPVSGITYSAFVDPSGGSADSMTLAIAHRDPDGRGILDAVREVRPPFSPEGVVEDFALLLKAYHIDEATGDHYSGEWVREQFRARGVEYAVSERSKSEIYREALPLLNSGKVELLDHPRLGAQLLGLERRIARGGKDSIDHRPGGHDDLANVAAGALVLAATDARPSLIPAAAIRIDKPDAPLGFVSAVYGALWIAPDGEAAYAVLVKVEDGGPRGSIAIADFDQRPWTSAVPEALAAALDRIAEEARDNNQRSKNHGVSALMFVPAQFRAICHGAMLRTFEPRLARIDAGQRLISCEPIEAEYLRNATDLVLQAGAAVAEGCVRLTAAAEAMTGRLPMFAALSARAGEDLFGDPLRAALLLGIVLGVGERPSNAAPAIPAARFAVA